MHILMIRPHFIWYVALAKKIGHLAWDSDGTGISKHWTGFSTGIWTGIVYYYWFLDQCQHIKQLIIKVARTKNRDESKAVF